MEFRFDGKIALVTGAGKGNFVSFIYSTTKGSGEIGVFGSYIFYNKKLYHMPR